MTSHSDLTALLSAAARRAPDHPALVQTSGHTLTWGQLDAEASAVAGGLGRLGIVGGHRVLIVLGNRTEFVSVYLGALRAHAVAVPVNPRSSGPDLAWMIADSGARVVVTDSKSAPAVREAVAIVRDVLAGRPVPVAAGVDAGVIERANEPQIVVLDAESTTQPGETSWTTFLTDPPAAPPASSDPERLAALLYTAGATGRPRAAMLTHRALLANIEQTAALEPPMMSGDDVVLAVLPLFHVFALNAVLGGALRQGAKVVLVERFDPETTLDVIAAESVTVLPVAPPVFAHWNGRDRLKERLASVRLVLSGSEELPAEVARTFTRQSGLQVHQGYGLTEAAPVVTTTLHSAQGPVSGSYGAPVPGVEIAVLDAVTGTPDDTDTGRLRIRGANLFSGYWPDGSDGPDADGWWETGDLGWLDDSGDLHPVDRARDVFVVSGFQVFPSEVEAVIAEVPGVREVAVVGADDAETGQSVVAYLVLGAALGQPIEVGEPADADAVLAAVEAAAEESLAAFKRPTRVEIVEALPTTTTGRVARGRLRGIERRKAHGLLD